MDDKHFELAINELSRFLNISYEEAFNRVNDFHPAVLAEQWKVAEPQSPKEVRRFYETSQDYLYDLMKWNYLSPVYKLEITPLLHYHDRKILEIGGGIGTLSIALAYAHNEVTFYDISPIMRNFTSFRVKERGLESLIKVIDDLEKAQKNYYDMVVAQDLFEHIHPDELKPLLARLITLLKPQGFIYHRSHFGQQREIYPQHFEDSKGFYKLAQEVGFKVQPNGDLIKTTQNEGVLIAVPFRTEKMDLSFYYSEKLLKKPKGSIIKTLPNKPADVARNMLAEGLEKDHILFWDSDVSVPSGALMRLLSWNLPVVTGLVLMRTGVPEPQMYKYYHKHKEGHFYISKAEEVYAYLMRHRKELDQLKGSVGILSCSKEELIPIDGAGMDFVLVRRDVLEKIKKPYFKYGKGTTSREDFYFFRKVRDAGFSIYLDSGVLCEHSSTHFRGWRHFLAWAGKEPYPWEWEG